MPMRILWIPALALAAACGRSGNPVTPGNRVVPPACASPAPLTGSFDARVADAYIVVYRADTDVAATTDRLQRKYGFTARYVYTTALKGFAATLTPEALAGIRCEAEVESTSYEGVITAQ